MDGIIVRFGKHKGLPVSEVPTAYLAWALDSLAECPAYVIVELTRRGSLESGAALIAQTAVNNAQWKQARRTSAANARYRKHQRHAGRRDEKRQARADRVRMAATAKMDAMRAGVTTVGREYSRLSAEFEQAGGDTHACPFDCDDYLYEGPTLGAAAGVREDWLAEFTIQTEQPV
jgi:hypothetical protein